MPIILVFRKLRQKDHQFEARLDSVQGLDSKGKKKD
jgi:hypothetical protein